MRFEWDELKNRANYRKHGIWFDEAQTVWADSRSAEFLIPSTATPRTVLKLGHSTAARLLIVVFCERTADGLIRIVSARKATTKERRAYEERI